MTDQRDGRPAWDKWGPQLDLLVVRDGIEALTAAASQSRVTKMLVISKLDTAIEVFDTEAEALQSFDGAQQAGAG